MMQVAVLICLFGFTRSEAPVGPYCQLLIGQFAAYVELSFPIEKFQQFRPGDKVDILAGIENNGAKLGRVIVSGATVTGVIQAAGVVRIRLSRKDADLIRRERRNRVIFLDNHELLPRIDRLPNDPFRFAG